MRGVLLFLLGAVLVAVLSLLCFKAVAVDIKDDLELKSQNAYKKGQFDQVRADVKGKALEMTRVLVLSGEVESNDKKIEAETIAQKLEGVLGIDNKIVVKTPIVQIKPEPVVIKTKTCQERFNELLLKSKINFEMSKSDIKKGSYKVLNQLVDVANGCSHAKVVVEGYTDSDGSDSLNKTLSSLRANAVKDYLIKNNISANRLEAIGYGAMNPIADNSTKEGKEQNRRIEFKIKGVE